jgi:ribosomal protein L30E
MYFLPGALYLKDVIDSYATLSEISIYKFEA